MHSMNNNPDLCPTLYLHDGSFTDYLHKLDAQLRPGESCTVNMNAHDDDGNNRVIGVVLLDHSAWPYTVQVGMYDETGALVWGEPMAIPAQPGALTGPIGYTSHN